MIDVSERKIEILANPLSLAQRVADWIQEIAMAKDGNVAIALSGGSTPRPIYELLAESPFRDVFPWARTHWFWGDERFVPQDDGRSNYRMVREALLSRAPIPPANIHPIPTDVASPEAAASAYEYELKSFYGAEHLDPHRPLFDVNLLGLGPDGHTASLFPGSAVLEEHDRWVAAVVSIKAEPRVTLTYPALASSRNVAFVVAGKDKRDILAHFCAGEESLPATHVHPLGNMYVFSDAAAMGKTML